MGPPPNLGYRAPRGRGRGATLRAGVVAVAERLAPSTAITAATFGPLRVVPPRHRVPGRARGGPRVMDPHTASHYNPLFDLAKGEWSERFAAHVAPLDRLPRLQWPTQGAGVVTAAAAEAG